MIIKLFTTCGCHLCEQALDYLCSIKNVRKDLTIELVEISDSEKLINKYGTRIPVIRVMDSELGWPFSPEELKYFLENKK